MSGNQRPVELSVSDCTVMDISVFITWGSFNNIPGFTALPADTSYIYLLYSSAVAHVIVLQQNQFKTDRPLFKLPKLSSSDSTVCDFSFHFCLFVVCLRFVLHLRNWFFFFFGSQTFDLCFSFSNGDMTRTYTSPCVLSPCVSVLINDSVIGRFPSHLCDTVMYISLWQTTVLCLYLLYP